MARCALGMLLVAGAALRLAAGQAGSFLTAPQRDPQLASFAATSVDVSADGRFVAFESYARLVPADTNDHRDVYVLDLRTKRVTLESATTGVHGDAARPRLSGDGHFIVFESFSFEPGDPAYRSQIVLGDRWRETSRVVSRSPGGAPADGSSRDADISDDGRIVVFASNATNLVAGVDANGPEEDVYAFDVSAGTIERVSVAGSESRPPGAGNSPSISGDGRWVAFAQAASTGGTAAERGRSSRRREPKLVLVRDLVSRTIAPVSIASRGGTPDGDSWGPAISRDGRFVAFVSEATNLAGPRNREADVFLRDLRAGATTLVSRTPEGDAANGMSGRPAISADGRFVAFQSDASNLECVKRCAPGDEDINLLWDVFVFDREKGSIVRESRDDAGGWMEASRGPALDASGRVLAFSSRHPIDAADQGEDFDLFVKIAPGEQEMEVVWRATSPPAQPGAVAAGGRRSRDQARAF